MFSLIIFSLLILSISCIDLRTYSFRFDQLSLLNESYIQGMYNFSVLRVTKFNRTTFCLNYEFETFREFDTNILIDYSISSRRLNSDQFTTWLDAPRRESISSAINRYERFFRNGLKKFLEHSNLPATLPMPYIRLKPGVYWLRDYAIDMNMLPLYIPQGVYKFDGILIEGSTTILNVRGLYICEAIKFFGNF